jgi:hypothetical protein
MPEIGSPPEPDRIGPERRCRDAAKAPAYGQAGLATTSGVGDILHHSWSAIAILPL